MDGQTLDADLAAGRRLMARLGAFAAFSDEPRRLTRLFLSDAHRRAAEAFIGWCGEAGLEARIDAAGNVVGGVNLLVDVGAWNASEQATQHLAAIVESSDDAIISKDLDGTIRSWNGAAERLFGYTASEIIGKSILTIIPQDRLSEETEIITRIRKGQRIEHYETMRRHKDGSLVDLSLTVSPVQNREGKVVGASKIARDIGERRQLERVKEHLVNEIKHRVKNTLGTVQAMAAQTFRKAPVEERNLFVGRIHALADAHDVLTQRNWGNVSLRELVTRLLHPFVDAKHKRMSSEGPDMEITPNRALLLAMVLHESGHAITAWLTGRWAVPLLWVTPHGQERSWLIVLLVTAVIGFAGFLAWKMERPGWLLAAAALCFFFEGTLLKTP